jgi:hypothetical protein
MALFALKMEHLACRIILIHQPQSGTYASNLIVTLPCFSAIRISSQLPPPYLHFEREKGRLGCRIRKITL